MDTPVRPRLPMSFACFHHAANVWSLWVPREQRFCVFHPGPALAVHPLKLLQVPRWAPSLAAE
eukprot:2963696-Lingulodinium_polyedra.AAC.1